MKFSEVAGVANFKPDFLGKKERKFATKNPPGFSHGWGGCKIPKFHHLDLLGPPWLSETCAIPYENKANGCDTSLCDTISKGYCAIWRGISYWAAKCNAQFSLVPAHR